MYRLIEHVPLDIWQSRVKMLGSGVCDGILVPFTQLFFHSIKHPIKQFVAITI